MGMGLLLCPSPRPSGPRLVGHLKRSLELMGAQALDFGEPEKGCVGEG